MPVVHASSKLRFRLDRLAEFTVSKLQEIISDEAKNQDSYFDRSDNSGYLFNESMVMMQLIEKIIAEYKFKKAEDFTFLENRKLR